MLPINPDALLPALVLFGLAAICFGCGVDALRNGKRSRFTMREIVLGLDRPSMAYNPETNTVVCGTLPEGGD